MLGLRRPKMRVGSRDDKLTELPSEMTKRLIKSAAMWIVIKESLLIAKTLNRQRNV